MIFITLGSQKFQFNRLLKSIDQLISSQVVKNEVFAQIGYSDYKPINYKYKQFLDRDEFSEFIDKSNIIITHGGTGTIIRAIKYGKKVIAVPRLQKFGEHVDDHQLQIVKEFSSMNLIAECIDCEKLGEILESIENTKFALYKSNTERFIYELDKFMSSLS